jgi:polysaccharide biosynthesis transport protein
LPAEVRPDSHHSQPRQRATKEVRIMIEHQPAPESVSVLRALEPPPEQPVDVRRYANALRRSRGLIAAIVLTLTGLVLALSLVLPKTYSAKATILLDQSPEITAAADAERQLATIQTLLTTRGVLAAAARRLPGESAETLAGKVQATVDPAANIIRIRASAASPRDAARIANAVATAFLARQRSFELRRLQAARTRLIDTMTRLRGEPGSKGEVALIRERLSELSVSEANAGSELQLADAARPPVSADSPRPLRNAVFAFVAALFIAVLVALGRERLAPRLGGAGELERLTGLPVLAEVQMGRRGLNAADASAERERYDALAGVIGMQLPQAQQHILLITSAVADEAKEKVTAGLGRALAQAGETTLVVDADLRRPTLEQLFGMEPAPGLAEILTAARNGDADAAGGMITEPPASASGRRATGSLAVLGAGNASPGAPLSPEALEIFFSELGRSAFTYVVIQGPPMLSPNDSRLWVQRVDGIIVVSRPDRLAPGDVLQARERLERVGGHVLGHVVVDG